MKRKEYDVTVAVKCVISIPEDTDPGPQCLMDDIDVDIHTTIAGSRVDDLIIDEVEVTEVDQ